MVNSLETRVPMLNHQLVELAWRLPMQFKLTHEGSKLPLQSILRNRLPYELFNRPKMGFECHLILVTRTIERMDL